MWECRPSHCGRRPGRRWREQVHGRVRGSARLGRAWHRCSPPPMARPPRAEHACLLVIWSRPSRRAGKCQIVSAASGTPCQGRGHGRHEPGAEGRSCTAAARDKGWVSGASSASGANCSFQRCGPSSSIVVASETDRPQPTAEMKHVMATRNYLQIFLHKFQRDKADILHEHGSAAWSISPAPARPFRSLLDEELISPGTRRAGRGPRRASTERRGEGSGQDWKEHPEPEPRAIAALVASAPQQEGRDTSLGGALNGRPRFS